MLSKVKNMVIASRRKKYYIENDTSKCIYCGFCQNCRHNAIQVDRTNKTWEWSDENCIRCNHCIEKCPQKSLVRVNNEK